MKKLFSVLLAACLLCGLLPLIASARTTDGVIRLRVNSDIAGCKAEDYAQIVELLSDNVAYCFDGNNGPLSISNAAGGSEYAHVIAGRSYAVNCILVAADGCALPETLEPGDLEIECGKGAKVVYQDVAIMRFKSGDKPILRIVATIVVDSNALQRIAGFFADLWLKIRSWQLY